MEEELNNRTKFYWKNTKDIVYKGLNIKFLKAFVATETKKPSGKTSSYEHIPKYFDAVQWGAKEADCFRCVILPGKREGLGSFQEKSGEHKKGQHRRN